jgi:hypothetical protein
MGLTAHTPEKSLLPIIGKGIVTFDIHISAIEEGGFMCQMLRQMDSNIAIIICSHMITSLLMPPRSIFPTVSCVTFRIPFTMAVRDLLQFKQ